ncbi:MAG: LysM peptidoglycan-binding domain-containing protein [Phycisphaerae bacterium]|nr:LysM peptidoglycan-binding domain-containing protein [Phycisphaerae bacterium]
MTSDAKIGLLLGLIFIFVIAFIINGLPSFRNATNNSELTTNMVSSQHENWGIGTNERKVQDGFDWAGQPIEKPVEEEVPSPAAEEEKEDVRFEMPIPGNITIVEETSIEITPELIERTLTQSSDPVIQPATEQIAPEPVETIVIELPPAEKKPKPRPARGVMPKVYVVSDGDTLGSIAKKFYGPVEGNKIANVLRMFEANRKSLESMHKIDVGQRIIVPPPRTSKPDEIKAESTPANSIFEKANQIGRRLFSGDKGEPKAKQPRQYVVQDGDTLWRVAAAQLGDASRYKEICKLNANVLPDENNLTIGLHLTLPAQ